MNPSLRPACCAAALVPLLACTLGPSGGAPNTTGPSTEQGNPQIVATVIDADKRPLEGAVVTVYIVSANSDSSQQPQSAVSAMTKKTDSLGVCAFENLPPRSYSLSVSDSAATRSALRTNITLTTLKPAKPEFTDTIELAAPGGMRGIVTRRGEQGPIVNQNLKDGNIQVKIGEVDGDMVTGPDGKYAFRNLPPGVYTVFYYTADFYTSKRENVTVRPGADTTLDTVVLKPFPTLSAPKDFGGVYDTAAGVVALHWRKVEFDGLRGYEVERFAFSQQPGTVYSCPDTLIRDTVSAFPSGTVLEYVVRAVDKAYNKGKNAGPVTVTVK